MQTIEEAVLGRLLQQPEFLDITEIDNSLFKSEKQRRIFNAIKKQWETERNADLMAIKEKSGYEFSDLISLTEGIHRINPEQFIQHVKKLKQRYLMWELCKESNKIQNSLEKGMEPDSTRIEEIATLIANLNHTEELGIETFKNLIERDIPERRLLIDPILGEREIAIVSGFPKSGKSILSMNLSIRLAQGKDWLGFKIPKPLKTLILQQEVSTPLFKERLLNMISSEKNRDFFENISHNTKRGLLIDTKEGFQSISQAIKSKNPSLVIIDPLIKFHTKKENSAEEMEIVFKQFHRLIDEYGVTFLIIHHFAKAIEDRKGGYQQRGSSVISASSDANWQWSFVPKDKYDIPEEDNLKVGELSFEFRNIESMQPLILKQSDSLWYERTVVRKKGKLDFHDIRIEIEKAGGRAYQRDIEKKFVPDVCSHRTFLKAVEEGEERGAYDSVPLEDQKGSPKLLFISEGERDKIGN